MRILTFNTHSVLTASLARSFRALGHELWIPTGNPADWAHWKPRLVTGWTDAEAGVQGIRPDLIDQTPFDVVLIPGHDVQRDVLRAVWPAQERLGARLVFFCGNELPHYRWDLAQNVLAADRASYEWASARGLHTLMFFPWIDYAALPYEGPSDTPVVRTYINDYAARFPQDQQSADRILAQVPGLRLEHVDGQDHAGVMRLMRESMATIHIKAKEGYGYSVLESLASGRPVLMPRKYVQGKTLATWVIDGESAMLFDDEAEAAAKLRRFLADVPFRHALQASSARLVREKVDNARETAALGTFLDQLKPQPAKSLTSRILDVTKRH